MKVKVFGPRVAYGPNGALQSWMPNELVDVDEHDKDAVAFYQGFVEQGAAEMVEEPSTKRAQAAAEQGAAQAQEDTLEQLRAQYKQATGIDADNRWGEPRLRKEIDKAATEADGE